MNSSSLEADAPDAERSMLREVKPPAKQAVVFICQRCERRIHADKGTGRRLARGIKKFSKEAYGKGAVRTVMTSCMSLCPRDTISVAVIPRRTDLKPRMYMVDPRKPKAAARELLSLIAET